MSKRTCAIKSFKHSSSSSSFLTNIAKKILRMERKKINLLFVQKKLLRPLFCNSKWFYLLIPPSLSPCLSLTHTHSHTHSLSPQSQSLCFSLPLSLFCYSSPSLSLSLSHCFSLSLTLFLSC